MTLDASAAAAFEPALLPPARTQPASRLVLFIGLPASAEVTGALAPEGMRCLWLPGRAAALEAARGARFDVAVIGAATLSTLAAGDLWRLRLQLGCPLLVEGGADDEADEIGALEQGADAYLPQPLLPRRLRAHLLALVRSPAAAPVSPEDALLCSWRVDRVHNRLHGATRKPVALTEAQAVLLQQLIDADGRVIARARLAEALPPTHGHALQARSVDVYVHRLRSRLRDAGAGPYDIEAVRGRGYRLCEARVDELADDRTGWHA